MFKITKKSIILTILATVIFPSLFIIYMFTPRAEITYNCDGYNIYKMVTPWPAHTIIVSIGKKSVSEGYYLFDKPQRKLLHFGNYPDDLDINYVNKTKSDYNKFASCKTFDMNILGSSKIDEIGKPIDIKDLCYLLNKTGKTDYPECSPEIKSKFELK